MGKSVVLDKLVDAGNGYLTTAQVLESGISKPTLASYVKEQNLRRVGHGIYLVNDAWEDSLYQLQLLNKKVVFSHETALFLQGLMEREPARICVTVPAGYNATHLRKRGVRVTQEKAETYGVGACSVRTNFGNPVCAYDMDRTLCDIIKNKASMDVQVFQYAMKQYMVSNKKNLNRLGGYAKNLGIESQVRIYTEVML
ncbi:AbiEi antitoxin N-terminal domain-containing protein [uncultured Varibaculum sp.]|uniref:type IV toxin-antitoxin system AbiEi family antitoxin domain-containing protein n=1 Tax=uncultured Varibaculum sp. TaxID=413896 RepID=UPI00267741E6|nr:AbiEi antitoxin N-terminal domain-containing protein [uncultured Varibaculum sp.]